MAVMAKPNPIAPPRPPRLVLAGLLVLLCAGCSGRFRTETYYVAPGFTVASLRGKTVAVLPLTDTDASATRPTSSPAPTSAPSSAPVERFGLSVRGGEFVGVAGGLREAGARVRLLSSQEGKLAAARPRNVAAAYLLVVRLTSSDVYHAFAEPHGGRAADRAVSRTTGRRVGLRLTLLRLPDELPVWLARGTGDVWVTREGPADARPAGHDTRVAPETSDRFAGGLALYPPPPALEPLSRRLTRRLIAGLPVATELEPN
jgi:hypothetical protein